MSELTRAQRKKLEFLTDEWREEDHDWKASDLFHRLSDRGLCEMDDRRVRGGDVLTGPGNTSAYRWFTRRTAAGRLALGLPADLSGSLAESAD